MKTEKFLMVTLLTLVLLLAPLAGCTQQISREQAIETASKMLRASIVSRAEIKAEIHGWYWEVIFDNINAKADELMPFPLLPPPLSPPGEPTPEPYPGIWQSVVATVDAETGDLLSMGAGRAPEPEPGPYISQEQAISSAREYAARIPTQPPTQTPTPAPMPTSTPTPTPAPTPTPTPTPMLTPTPTPTPNDLGWIEKARVEAYLRGGTWIVLFWEEGSSIKGESAWLSVHRIRVAIDAVTGAYGGASRG